MRSGWLILASLLTLSLAAPAAAEEAPPAEVMLIGVFHFANPGLDVVKTDVIDVMTAENQAYLESLTDRIAAFDPDVVLLEFDPEQSAEMQQRYEQYLEGRHELTHNENDQLGFRIAKKAGLDTVVSYDERNVHWNAGPMMERIEGLPERKATLDAQLAEIGAKINDMQATLGFGALLKAFNDPALDRQNKAIYLTTNDIGAGEGFEGADAAASWWRRNFRMYANIQRHAPRGSRVVVVGGQGHTAILRDFLRDDPDRVEQDVRPLF